MKRLLLILISMQCHQTYAIFDIMRACTAYKNNDLETAQALYAHVALNKPDHYESLYNLGKIAYKQDNFEMAQAYFEQTLQQQSLPEQLQEQALFDLGNSQARLRKWQEALHSFEQVLEKNPDNDYAKKTIAQIKKILEQEQQDAQKDSDNQPDQSDQPDQPSDQQDRSDTDNNDKQQEKDEAGGNNESDDANPTDQHNDQQEQKNREGQEQQEGHNDEPENAHDKKQQGNTDQNKDNQDEVKQQAEGDQEGSKQDPSNELAPEKNDQDSREHDGGKSEQSRNDQQQSSAGNGKDSQQSAAVENQQRDEDKEDVPHDTSYEALLMQQVENSDAAMAKQLLQKQLQGEQVRHGQKNW